jgi:chaperone modulatory protein CbpM
VSYALIRARRLDLDEFAADAGRDPRGRLWFRPAQLAAVARIQRLRAGFALNYAAIGLVTDLLDQIAALQASLRTAGGSPGGRER